MSDDEAGLIRNRPSNNYKCKGLVALAVIIVAVIIVVVATRPSKEPPPEPAVTTADQFGSALVNAFPSILTTIRTFMGVALANNGSRAVALGYNASAEYVIFKLEAAGYKVERQPLVVPVWTELSAPTLTQRNISFLWKTDFSGTRYGGNCSAGCEVTGRLVDVPNFGCNQTDYVADYKDAIAVITVGGTCEYFDKAVFCEQVGCAAILLRSVNGVLPGARVRKTGWVGGDKLTQIPCLGVTASIANVLLATNESVSLRVHAQLKMEHTFNLMTTSEEGDPERTIIYGSHLDSVPEGPGVNDNGSGSAMNLQLAVEFAALAKAQGQPVNRVRFAWWAAEEIGLLGAYHFVNGLQNKKFGNETIVLALNFDMMASPNGQRQVHNGSQVPPGTSADVIEKSNRITSLFGKHFDSHGKNWTGVDMLGGSDFLPFILAGIPAGGLSTGAAGAKSMEQRITFGGLANAAMDPCYHLICDTVENLGIPLYMDNVRAAANVLWALSHDPHLMQ